MNLLLLLALAVPLSYLAFLSFLALLGVMTLTGKDGPIVGLQDPRPDGPDDRGGFHGHSAAPAHCDMGPARCDASMSNCDVPGSDHDASMPNRDVASSDGNTSMSGCDMTGHRDTF